MQLKRIQHYLGEYRRFLNGPRAETRLYYWESQRCFQENWDLRAEDLAAVYDRSLQNSRTRRLWNRENYAPKAMLLKFFELEPDYVRHLFTDLFNEDKEVTGRAQRFVFYCDELLRMYKDKYPARIENNHFHDDDYGMISLYLAFRYPDRYAPYDFDVFVDLLRRLGRPDLPAANDLERYFKVMRTLYKMMQKDEALLTAHQKRLRPGKDYAGDSLLLAFDFAVFCTEPDADRREFTP